MRATKSNSNRPFPFRSSSHNQNTFEFIQDLASSAFTTGTARQLFSSPRFPSGWYLVGRKCSWLVVTLDWLQDPVGSQGHCYAIVFVVDHSLQPVQMVWGVDQVSGDKLGHGIKLRKSFYVAGFFSWKYSFEKTKLF